MATWLVTIAQLPTEDPAARMRVLRTLESLGTAVIREGAYLLPDTATNRQALDALAEYIAKSAGSAYVLQVQSASPAQQERLRRLFDRSSRYIELIKTVESLRVGFGHSDPSAISRVLHKQRREFEAIAALDFFPTAARERAQRALAEAESAVRKLLFPAQSQTALSPGEALLAVRDELVSGLARERLEVLHRTRVGGEHLQHLPGLQLGERLLGAQDRQRAVQPAGVEFLVEVHASYYAAWTNRRRRPLLPLRVVGCSPSRSCRRRIRPRACGCCARSNRSARR